MLTGREKIFPEKEKVKAAYQEYKKCQAELKSLDMDEEQKNREMAFLEFEINEIEKASLVPGEDRRIGKAVSKALQWTQNYRFPAKCPCPYRI